MSMTSLLWLRISSAVMSISCSRWDTHHTPTTLPSLRPRTHVSHGKRNNIIVSFHTERNKWSNFLPSALTITRQITSGPSDRSHVTKAHLSNYDEPVFCWYNFHSPLFPRSQHKLATRNESNKIRGLSYKPRSSKEVLHHMTNNTGSHRDTNNQQ